MTQLIEKSFLIDLLTTNNAIYRDLLTLKLKVDELMNYFKTTEKKAKKALAVINKVFDKFPETQTFINKAYNEECRKENISLKRYFLALLTIVNFFLCYDVMLFFGLLQNTTFSFISLIGSRSF